MKQHPNKATRALCLLCCFAQLFCCTLAYAAPQEQQLRTVRVGFFAFDGYHMLSSNGERSGYGYEILQRMVGYTDWELEYVGYDKGWGDMQDMLENGEIDLLTSAQMNDERKLRFDFSAEPIGTSSSILTVKEGNNQYLTDDYANWNGIRVGLINGSSRNAGFADFAKQNGFEYRSVYYDDEGALTRALMDGRVDAALTSNLRSITGEWIVAHFDASPFYAIVRKGDTELLSQVNEAIALMYETEPEVCATLMDRYYTPKSGVEIAFTIEEREYIEALRQAPLTAIVNPDRAPYTSYKNGEPYGVIGSIAEEIIRRSGLSIRFVQTADREEYVRTVEAGGIDLRFDAWHSYDDAAKLGYRLTEPYLDVPITRLYRKGAKAFDTLALVRNSDIAKRVDIDLEAPDVDITYYDSSDEVVAAVLGGKQDMAYLYAACSELAIQQDETNQLVMNTMYGYDNAFCVAVSATRSHLLYSILNKTVASIPQSRIESIMQLYTSYEEKPTTLVSYMYSNPFGAVGLVLLSLALIGLVVLLVHLSRKSKRESKRLAQEERRTELLQVALASAERANAAKSQFLSRMSHEMRTPLNAVIGLLSMMKGAEAEKQEAYRISAASAAKQLLGVINDVLDMSAIESGRLKLARAPFDLTGLIRGISSMYEEQCTQKGLQFETRYLSQVDDWLVGDQLRLNQILLNLLNNAVKFTKKGRVRLELSQHDATGDRVFVRFEVSDTGEGISADMKERLFKPFEQESAETAQRHGGSGLGLSIVKNLVSLMDGAIDVKSEPGKGSTFTVDLPFLRDDSPPENRPKLSAPRGFENRRVLLAEDNALNRMVAMELLRKNGIACEAALDGREAVDKFLATPPGYYDAILMDIQMPNLDGMEATREIRASAHPEAGTIQIIALTANAFVEDVARMLSCGMNAHVAKPIMPKELFGALEHAFAQKR